MFSALLAASTPTGQATWAGEAAPSARSYVALARDVRGMLHEPVISGDKAKIAVLVMHSDANSLEFSAGTELARRGYRVLCANVEKSDRTTEAKMLKLNNWLAQGGRFSKAGGEPT